MLALARILGGRTNMPAHRAAATRRLLPIVAVLAACASPAVQAQSGTGPKVSSRDEYRACLDEQDEFKRRVPVLQARLAEHNQDLKRFQDEMNAHVATQAAIDTTDQAAVDAFNARLDELNQRVGMINARGEEFSREQKTYNTQVAAANKRCAGMVFTLRDRDAVAKERAAQGRK
jgi:uncharacterized protein YlxW (UPF0749 family)